MISLQRKKATKNKNNIKDEEEASQSSPVLSRTCSAKASFRSRPHPTIMTESLSLTEVRSSSSNGMTADQLEQTRLRSLSVQLVMNHGAHHPRSVVEHSRSDSSFNYESNVSELMDGKALANYFEYRSLESLESPTVDGSLTEEANSIQVNFDEGSTFNSPGDELLTDGLDVHQLYAAAAQQTLNHDQGTLLNGEEDVDVEEPTRPTPPPPPPPPKSSSGRKGKSQSTRERSKASRTGGGAKPPAEHQQCHPASSASRRGERHEEVEGILPIFKQLIVQKQLESTGAHSQPLDTHQDENEEVGRMMIKDSEDRQLSSCPNLSIKCDVVEYF